MTLLRLVRALPDSGAQRVTTGAGRGRVRPAQGTQLRDAADRCRDPKADILYERSSDSFATWLPASLGVELICRTGPGSTPTAAAGAYRTQSRSPTADTCGTTSARPSSERSAAIASTCRPRSGRRAPGRARRHGSTAAPTSGPELSRSERIADRTRARHADVHRLLGDGLNLRETAAALGLSCTPFAGSPGQPARKSSSSTTAPTAAAACSVTTLPVCSSVELRLHQLRPAVARDQRPRINRRQPQSPPLPCALPRNHRQTVPEPELAPVLPTL